MLIVDKNKNRAKLIKLLKNFAKYNRRKKGVELNA
jgi:hypothetical protein